MRKREPTAWEKAMGKRLRRLRAEAGLSQAGAARAAGVPVKTYVPWDQGKRSFSFETAAKLADALGVDLNELAGRKGPKGKGAKGGGR
jgi:transcriptional regulator with XRE-family HTH domain